MRSDTSQHAVYLSFNFAAAVCIVLINKAIFSRINFGFSTTLTLAHYVLNIAGLEALRLCGAFELRPLPLNTSTAVLTVVVGAAPAINNLALKLNDVGFYTTCKLLVTPCIVVLELALFSKRVSLVRALCLAGVCAGVGAASVSDFSLNLPGLLASLGWARLAAALPESRESRPRLAHGMSQVPIAAAYKVLWSRVAKGEAGGEPWHTLALMRAVLPWSTLVIGAMVPLVDPPGLLQCEPARRGDEQGRRGAALSLLGPLPCRYEWTVERAALLGASSVGAFLVNWSGFLVMGACSALTHTILGQPRLLPPPPSPDSSPCLLAPSPSQSQTSDLPARAPGLAH